MRSGPIVIIEDDADDKTIFEEILQELAVKNKLIWFIHSTDAYQYLMTTSDQPFLIFCDVNIPGDNGLEFKRQIDNNPFLRRKSIPFVFYSTSVDQYAVNEAYTTMTVQGFFQKGNTYEEMKRYIRTIIDYWLICSHPNTR